jgi:hypothetical protein
LTTFCGTGTVIEVLDPTTQSTVKTLVLTTSHLSQGEGLVIGGGVRVLGRLSNNRRDLEVFEVQTGVLSRAAVWLPEERRVVFDRTAIEKFRGSDAIVYQEEKSLGPARAFVPKPNWVMPNTVDAPTLDISFAPLFVTMMEPVNRLLDLPISEEVLGRGEISPQMSGAPLVQGTVDTQGHFQWVLRGVTSQLSRDFIGSWFVSDQAVARLIAGYLNGQRNDPKSNPDSTRWRLFKGVTYRDYGNGDSETLLLRDHAGGATRGDGGGATRGDGGGPDGAGGSALAAQDISRLFGAGIVFNGVPAFGLTIAKNRTVFGDRMAFDWIRLARIEPKSIEIVKDGMSLRPLLIARLESFPWFKMLAPVSLKKSVRSGGTFVLESRQNPFEVEENDPRVPQLHTLLMGDDGFMTFTIDLRHAGQGFLRFKLDPAGRLINEEGGGVASRFVPVLHLKSKNGQNYAVDLRRLFFIDLASAGVPRTGNWFPLSEFEYQEAARIAFEKAEMEAPTLVVRSLTPQASSSESWVLPFTKVFEASASQGR